VQALVILALSAALGADFDWNPLRIIAALAIVVIGAAFFACLSMAIAGIVLARERLMGIGQMITMPLFFASTALYPRHAMPGWLQVVSELNPLSYEINALRGLLLHTHANIAQDVAVLVGSLIVGIAVAARLLVRLVR
jgi:ABC-2 type transport system permease protein